MFNGALRLKPLVAPDKILPSVRDRLADTDTYLSDPKDPAGPRGEKQGPQVHEYGRPTNEKARRRNQDPAGEGLLLQAQPTWMNSAAYEGGDSPLRTPRLAGLAGVDPAGVFQVTTFSDVF